MVDALFSGEMEHFELAIIEMDIRKESVGWFGKMATSTKDHMWVTTSQDTVSLLNSRIIPPTSDSSKMMQKMDMVSSTIVMIRIMSALLRTGNRTDKEN